MSLNNSGTNMNSVSKKRIDSNGMKTEVASEIGFPNNKDKGKGKKGRIVRKG
jgi:hypothetical protein